MQLSARNGKIKSDKTNVYRLWKTDFSENNGETKLEWNVEFEVENEEIFAQVKPGIEEIYTTSSQKLAELSR